MSTIGNRIKKLVIGTPFENMARAVYGKLGVGGFEGSTAYWESRYNERGNSGAGSYGRLAQFKADAINQYVAENSISSVIEFGCGDGHQLELAKYEKYLGFDVSEAILEQCRAMFSNDSGKQFMLMQDCSGQTAELSMSLDVIYHLVEDVVFEDYMDKLFDAAEDHVIIYSSNSEEWNSNKPVPHVRHRRFTDWIDANRSDWELIATMANKYPYSKEIGDLENTSFADFYFYQKQR